MILRMKNKVSIGILVVLSGFLFSCSEKKEKEKDIVNSDEIWLKGGQLRDLGIKVWQPEIGNIVSNVYLNGKIEVLPNHKSLLSPDINGKVVDIYVQEGDYVKKGQKLMRLKSLPYLELQEQYLKNLSEREFLEVEFKRQQELNVKNVGALAEYQIAEAKLAASMSQEAALKERLSLIGTDFSKFGKHMAVQLQPYFYITAPISGSITKLPIAIGELVIPENTLAEIINTDELKALVYVYEKDIDKIEPNQEVEIDFINASIPNAHGKVMFVESAVDEATKAVTMHVKFKSPSKNARIFPNMSVKAVLNRYIIDKDEYYIVPTGAIFTEGEYNYIFITDIEPKDDEEESFRRVKINVKAQNYDQAEIEIQAHLPQKFFIVANNPTMLEAERKKIYNQ